MVVRLRSVPSWASMRVLVALLGATALVIWLIRVPLLETLGDALVVEDSVAHADVIVLTIESGPAGVLEASDLVRAHVADRVAVFEEVGEPAISELIRRGVSYEGDADRAVGALQALGIPHVVKIPRSVSGTNAEGAVLGQWAIGRGFHSVIVVTSRDHSRRVRRVLHRALNGVPLQLSIRPSRYSSFDSRSWWRTRAGMRTGIIELEKLLVDLLLHPLS